MKKKSQQMTKSMKNYPACKKLTIRTNEQLKIVLEIVYVEQLRVLVFSVVAVAAAGTSQLSVSLLWRFLPPMRDLLLPHPPMSVSHPPTHPAQRSEKISPCTGAFLPISRGRILAPFPIENSHLFPNTMSVFPKERKVKKKIISFLLFFLFILETTTTYEKQ